MNIPLITLDTSVILEYLKKQDKREYVEQLIDLANRSKIDLAVTARIHEDVPRDPLAGRLKELPALNIRETGTVMRIDVGIIDRDIIGDDSFSNFESLGNELAKQRMPGKDPPDDRDWDHLHGHYLLHRDVFLTWDEPILCLYDELKDQFGIIVMKPEEYLNRRWILHIFQLEVIRQCKYAITASEDLHSAIEGLNQGTINKSRPFTSYSINISRIWYSIQSLLTAVGIISLCLWPIKLKYTERGELLRNYFCVPKDSPLKERKFRNSFEHIDERFEEWAKTTDNHSFIDSNVGSPDMFGKLNNKKIMRQFNPNDYTIMFRGEIYNLKLVIESIKGILNNLPND